MGRGLDYLFAESPLTEPASVLEPAKSPINDEASKTNAQKRPAKGAEPVESVVYIGLNDIKPNASQPRKNFDPESLQQLKSFVDAELTEAGYPVETRRQMDIAVDEVFGNIARYAYEGTTGSAVLRIETQRTPQAGVLTFLDSGIPFDPLQTEAPDTTLKARERKIGGLGIFVVKKLMDEAHYEYADGMNVLRLKKRIPE